jgi:hypothetical protein
VPLLLALLWDRPASGRYVAADVAVRTPEPEGAPA